MRVHTVPLDDLKDHAASIACGCKPTIKDTEGGQVVVHNSYDGREFYEPDNPNVVGVQREDCFAPTT